MVEKGYHQLRTPPPNFEIIQKFLRHSRPPLHQCIIFCSTHPTVTQTNPLKVEGAELHKAAMARILQLLCFMPDIARLVRFSYSSYLTFALFFLTFRFEMPFPPHHIPYYYFYYWTPTLLYIFFLGILYVLARKPRT